MRLFLLAPLALAACAIPAAQATPSAARLSQTTLTVTLTDGSTCRADWAAAGGEGRLDDCGPGFGYRVAVAENPNVLRKLWEQVFAALGAEGATPPMAEVTLTRDDGRDWTFASPPPLPVE